jgi:ribosomal protein S18 acetylase RimI-like enzyme
VSGAQPLSALRKPEGFIPVVLPWVREAGNPYYDWLFGGPDQAWSVLNQWMRRASSEVAVWRMLVLVDDGRPTGGFIALGGEDLQAARRADASALAALAMAADPAARRELVQRLGSGRGLFPQVHADEFYLSKLGVETPARGAGRGSRLLEEYFATGARLGFRRFRLDVSAGNRVAVGLYERFGFRTTQQSSGGGAMTYLSMVAERDPDTDVAPYEKSGQDSGVAARYGR